ncbi:hypothetical protein A676_04622 [Salmonella enterica subsp. enterica serovar Enteritidis str. 2010K-0262]|uniref:Uncharacterized protein n=2 Tax=Salmonella enterica I TaxID=59201 RepID=M7RFC2_SALDU|nr:hypothetical protein A670_04536 [Salmonella enterica subsp. enterica serovar Dublin str. UC16]EPI63275.1 hypothetical protein A672_04694 [Salmonella enterica subsp. enterica serovar Enteritidis str. 08-1080]EPI63332.1 hypothetical protein A673_04790 [Salmonella enterica subsp. enterica serovar Enteritidis str. 2009K0958]EPI63483.1 hypothetical protein A671_05199 [Salmonella enterica subsp. enterica serovar Dublin str. DG22]EPI79235.1 hypothetical protein A676_04622 [Salmonella enterica subsp
MLFSHEWHQRHVTRRKFSVQRRNANIINNRYLLSRYSGPNEAPGCAHCSVVSFGRRPPICPCSLAAASPALVRSTISSRSISMPEQQGSS